MAKSLQLSLVGDDSSLSDALKEVRDAAGQAKESLEEVKDEVQSIDEHMQNTAQAAERLEGKLDEVGQSASAAKSGTSTLDSELKDVTLSAESVSINLDDVAQSELRAASGAIANSDATDQMEEQMQEAANAAAKLTASVTAEGAAAGGATAPNNALAQSLDRVDDKADDATTSLAGTASMAELLSLKSSALSINVGAFTVALRNLTTQVPLLVASLGNLATAFAGVGTALGSIGVGGFAVALGGAVGHVEDIAGPMATMEEKMQAMTAIGKEFMSMLREGIQPLVELEDSTDTFISLLEGLATTVRVFSQSIADSYADGPLREAIDTISGAWMDSIVGIGDSIEYMLAEIGQPLANVVATMIEQLDDFIVFATTVVSDMIQIFGAINDEITVVRDGQEETIGTVKLFLTELMELGRFIASGLAPVLQTFFEIVGKIANEVTELGSSTVGAAAQVVALALAMNKLVGIGASLVQPLGIAVGQIFKVADASDSATSAFTRMAGKMTSGLTSISSGFGTLSATVASAMPFMDPEENNLSNLADSIDDTGGPLSRFNSKLGILGGSSDDSAGAITRLRGATAALAAKLGLADLTTRSLANSVLGKLIPSLAAAEAASRSGEFGIAANATDEVENLSTELSAFKNRTVRRFREMGSSITGSIGKAFNSITTTVGKSILSINSSLLTAQKEFGNFSTEVTGLEALGVKFNKFKSAVVGGASDIVSAFVGKLIPTAVVTRDAFNFEFDEQVTGFAAVRAKFNKMLSTAITTAVGMKNAFLSRISPTATVLQQFGNFRGEVQVTGFEALKAKILTARVQMNGLNFDAEKQVTGLTAVRANFRQLGESAINSAKQMWSSVTSYVVPSATIMQEFGNFEGEVEVTGFAAIRAKASRATGSVLSSMSAIKSDVYSKIVPSATVMQQFANFEGEVEVTGFAAIRAKASKAIGSAIDGVASLKKSFFSVVPTLTGLQRSLNSLGTYLVDLDASSVRAALSMDSLRSSSLGTVGAMIKSAFSVSFYAEKLDDASKKSGKLGAAARALKGGLGSLGSLMVGLGGITDALGAKMIRSGGRTRVFGAALRRVSAVMKGNVAVTKGLRAAYATLVGASTGASLSQLAYSTATTIASAATSLLSGGITTLLGILATLATALGGIVAIFAGLIAIMGTVAAGLMLLGEGGKDADDVISSFKETLGNIADAVMPLVVSSGNAMIDIFNSILYPIKALVSGFKDMAVALGFMEGGESASNMDILASSAEWLAGVVDKVGDAFRVASGAVTVALEEMMGALQKFLVDIKFGDKVRQYISVLRELYSKALPKLKSALKEYVIKYFNLVKDLIENLVGSVKNVGQAFSEALNLGGIDFGGIMGALKSFGMFLIGLIDPVMNLVGSITAGAKQIYDILIFVVEGALLYVAKILGVVVDAVTAFMEGLTGMSGGEMAGGIMDAFGMIADSVGPVINAIAGIIDALVFMTDIAMSVLGPIGGAVLGIVDVMAGVLMPIVRAVGQMIRWVFGNLVGVISGTIDFIVGYFQMLAGVVSELLEGDIGGAFDKVKQFGKDSIAGLLNFVKSRIGRLGEIIGEAFESIYNTIKDAFLNLPSALAGMFGDIASGIADAIIGAIGGIEFTIPEVTIGGQDIPYTDKSIPDITIGGNTISLDGSGGGGGGSSGGGGGGGGGSDSSGPSDSNRSEGDLFSGLDTMGGLGSSAADAAGMGGTASGVEYYEGDTKNEFRQQISADPEDKSQIGRVAKDAMREANSFSRRQQGGQ